MSRVIDLNNPESWTEGDLAYLRDRPETVPVGHRHVLAVTPRATPGTVMGTATEYPTSELTRLQNFLTEHYPAAMLVAGRSAVDVAIELLSLEVSSSDDYDEWKVPELRKEAADRGIEGATGLNKADVIAALREWDQNHPE